MPDQNNDLPEGTDKIVSGASAGTTGGGSASDVTIEETDVMVIEVDDTGPAAGAPTGLSPGGSESVTGPTPDEPMSSRMPTSGGAGKGAVMDKIRSGGEKLSGQAADKARGLVGQGLERGAEALSNVGRMIGDTADGIDERLGEEYGDYARRAATAIDNAATNLANKDADELIDDTRTFVRKSPGIALAGAAVVGFALARLIKAGLDRDTDDDGSDRGRNSSEA